MPNHYSRNLFILQAFFPKKFRNILSFFQNNRWLLKQPPVFCSWDPAFVQFDVHQYDIRAYPANTIPRDQKVTASSHQPEKPAWPRNHDCNDVSLRQLHLHIRNKTQPFPVTDADHLFALQLRKSDRHTLPPQKEICFSLCPKNRKYAQEIHTDLRMVLMAFFSSRDTCA